ncbi:G protein-coupled receptor kinase-interactor 2, isoform CRA_a [Mus musculus]|nr:G protein-coupled receptor kinase-interactor 2, isoform CRA_a [Mus musculus]
MSKRLRSSDVCADCNGPDPSWASVNRGTFICDECCSVHRSLGRHISQVRHLKHTAWPPTLLQMVETLYNNGANSIWEHSLLDPASIMSGRRKANPQDKVHPNKAEFIRAKYQMLAFVHRLPCREDDSVTAKDLSKQLHSSVRTGNLETCLRLLSLGAQANFFHPEKGSTPLHVASKAGQILQAELLAVYGADPGTQDSSGKTPVDYARQGGHHELAERLIEIQYELTDRLAFYLCGRKPDHKSGQHFLIPQRADSLDLSELAKAAKKKLQSLSNHLFEELAMDVYDEVDRRETDAVWLATQNHSTLVTETTVVPFLPVNPEYSSTRNQASGSTEISSV